jgi:iron(II)-dependent oxidoreductase
MWRERAMVTQTRTTSDALIDDLRDARRIELALFADLTDEQLLGPKQRFVEPPLWEVGHVGWFQEYWILRHLHGASPLLEAGDSIYDSFHVSYKLRWDHEFPSREETLTYLETVLGRCIDRLQDREPTGEEAYFYRHVTQHEYMHSESLTTIRQTLGYPRPVLRE